ESGILDFKCPNRNKECECDHEGASALDRWWAGTRCWVRTRRIHRWLSLLRSQMPTMIGNQIKTNRMGAWVSTLHCIAMGAILFTITRAKSNGIAGIQATCSATPGANDATIANA